MTERQSRSKSKEGPSDEELKDFVTKYVRSGGNKSAVSRETGLARQTVQGWVKYAEERFGLNLEKLAGGSLDGMAMATRPLPPSGKVARYVITSIQNNTYLHPEWRALKALSDYFAQFGPSEFMAGTFSYAVDAYGAKAVKRGTWKPDDGGPWYAPEILEYVCDERVELAPSLVWCGEMNILPTAIHPLSGLETYNGRKSNIFPHAKIAMESVPSMPTEGTKLNFTTGTVTQRNYIQKRAGIVAEAGHTYGGLVVEVTSDGDWFVRQLHIDASGAVYDVAPSGRPCSVIRATKDGVEEIVGGVEALVAGDIHSAEMDPWVRECTWGDDGMVDSLRPRRQVFSMRSRGHHEMRDFHALYAKQASGQDSVEVEMDNLATFLETSRRDWCETVVVPSNHDRHLTRWLNEEDPRRDLLNARYHVRLQNALLSALDAGDFGFNVLEWALREKGIPDDIRFLSEDESFVVCKERDGGIECGLHGDRGPAGSRGSTRNLAKLGRAVIKAHDHTATIRDNVYSVGACSLSFPYMKGPSAHSITHAVVFENGKRQLVTLWRGKWRA
jgi:hypothetical protein